MTELTILAYFHHVFGYLPVLPEGRTFDYLNELNGVYIVETAVHRRTVFDVTINVYAKFAIEAGIMVYALCYMFNCS